MSEPGSPARDPLSSSLREALEQLCATDSLLVALDFDGTMAPLVDDPTQARATPAAAEAFSALAGLPRTCTALMSGRSLESLRAVAKPSPSTWLIGSHGAQRWLGEVDRPLTLTQEQHDRLRALVRAFEQVAAECGGAMVELKPAGAVLHTRQCPDGRAGAVAREQARARAEGLGVAARDGKEVLEASVVHADKGAGLEVLRQASGASAVFFAGDDVTDEDAFAALGPADVGVKVGPGPTRASFRVGGVDEVPTLLARLLRQRHTAVVGW